MGISYCTYKKIQYLDCSCKGNEVKLTAMLGRYIASGLPKTKIKTRLARSAS